MTPTLTIALAGNPNAGKTTVFNALTGARHKVGNYPGVTVEKIQGVTSLPGGVEADVVDLPGTYSLTPYSTEEVVARNFLIEEHPDLIVAVVDASNLERHLYLATQLLELGLPMVLVMNMADIARARGFRIDYEGLSRLLGVPVIPTVASQGEGIEELKAAILDVGRDPDGALQRLRHPNYGPEVEPHVRGFAEEIARTSKTPLPPRWLAVKLLEADDVTLGRVREHDHAHADDLLARAGRLRKHIEDVCGDSAEMILADRRYGYISGACTETVRQPVEDRHHISDEIDKLVTHRALGLPIFAMMMYGVFQLTFWVGGPIVDLLDWAIHVQLTGAVAGVWPAEAAPLLRSLLLDGVIGGVGSVLVFVPLIVLLFLGVAILEDTGYMARAAFLMDRLMHRIGLHGKSFVPMLIGFGCSVPGIMATRVLETRRDRLVTMLVLPLMSCGARLPIYMLILPAMFPPRLQTPMLWLIYLIGIVIAVVMARVFRATLFRGESTPFVMELPPYRMPTARGLGVHVWERTWMYVRKAGTIILLGSILLWAVSTFPRKTTFSRDYEQQISQAEQTGQPDQAETLRHQRQAEELQHTVAGRIGRTLEPVLEPAGMDWRVGTALIGAFAAKEIFVTQLGIVYSLGDAGQQAELRKRIRADYTPLQGFCICLFCLISMPCFATFAVTVREAGSWLWGLFLLGYLTALAWLLSTAVYQVGRLIL